MTKIYSAAMTPLTENNLLDVKSLERMLNRNIDQGVNGFFMLGSMGEGLIIRDEMKEEVVKEACKIIDGRADTLVGISDYGLERTLDNVKTYRKYDFSHYVLVLPNKNLLTVNNPLDYVLEVADAVDRPMYFYYLPSFNNCPFTIDQFRELLAHPMIVGIKNSSGLMYTRRELLLLKDEGVDFQLLEGQEWSIDEALILGCDGFLCGMTSLVGGQMKKISTAVGEGNFDEAQLLQREMIHCYHGIFGHDLTTIWCGQKYALKKLGIFSSSKTLVQGQDEMLTPEVKERIDTCLEEYSHVFGC